MTPRPAPRTPLSPRSLRTGVAALVSSDADLARAVTRAGPPPMWARPPGFATLTRVILEQQVSLTSGAAAYRRLSDAAGRVTPARVATLGERRMRVAGITRQKARYCHGLATAISTGALDLAALAARSDDDVRAALVALPGIGPWTADIYLLMALRRPDIWPTGDLALVKAARIVKGDGVVPDQDTLTDLARAWSPWRAVAARILWRFYLATRK